MRTFKFVLPLALAIVLAVQQAKADPGTWTGTLASKAADAKEGVVAVLKVKDGDKEVSVNLWAEGETAKKLTDLAALKTSVTVTGTKVDETNVKVEKIEQK